MLFKPMFLRKPNVVQTHVEVMSVLILKNKHPVIKEKIVTTVDDNQSSTLLKVYQGERSKSTDNILLGDFVLNNLPLAPRAVTKVKIRSI